MNGMSAAVCSSPDSSRSGIKHICNGSSMYVSETDAREPLHLSTGPTRCKEPTRIPQRHRKKMSGSVTAVVSFQTRQRITAVVSFQTRHTEALWGCTQAHKLKPASTLRFPQGCCNLAATHDWTVVQSIHQMNACHPETQNWSPSPYEYGQLCLANCQNHILNMILTFV